MLTHTTVRIFFFMCVCIYLLFSASSFSTAEAAENNILMLPEISVNQNQTGTFGLYLNNADLVTGGQIRFTYAMKGFQITEVSLTSRTTSYEAPDVQISVSDLGNVEVQVVLYSLRGAAIIPGDGEILMFHYQTSSDVDGSSPLVFAEKSLLSGITVTSLAVSLKNGYMATPVRIALENSEKSENLSSDTSEFSKIPEPSTLVFFGIGLLGLFAFIHEKRRYSGKG